MITTPPRRRIELLLGLEIQISAKKILDLIAF
jgi:hypothetical protein